MFPKTPPTLPEKRVRVNRTNYKHEVKPTKKTAPKKYKNQAKQFKNLRHSTLITPYGFSRFFPHFGFGCGFWPSAVLWRHASCVQVRPCEFSHTTSALDFWVFVCKFSFLVLRLFFCLLALPYPTLPAISALNRFCAGKLFVRCCRRLFLS